MEFYLSNETIKRSKFKFLKPRDIINLELPLKYGTKISGHICQGHVDTVGKVLRISKVDKSYVFEFDIQIGRAHVRTPVTEKSRMPSSA